MITTDAPEALFRQAMEASAAALGAPLTPEREHEARLQLHGLLGDLLARRDMKRDPRLLHMLLACRLRLRALQNAALCAREEGDFLACPCELREYTADLCAAANVLLAPLGRAVRFEAPEEPMECPCAPRDYAWLALELICNCALHCPGEDIAVSLQPMGTPQPRGKKRARVFTLTVACEGPLDLAALHAAGLRSGSGVAAMRRVAWLHHGALLWLERDGRSVAAFRLGVRNQGPGTRGTGWYDPPDYVDMLSDPCSQVYVALAPVTGG